MLLAISFRTRWFSPMKAWYQSATANTLCGGVYDPPGPLFLAEALSIAAYLDLQKSLYMLEERGPCHSRSRSAAYSKTLSPQLITLARPPLQLQKRGSHQCKSYHSPDSSECLRSRRVSTRSPRQDSSERPRVTMGATGCACGRVFASPRY